MSGSHTRGVIVFINGRFVPEAEAVVSVFDRGFLYGDGLFETTRVLGGRPFIWDRHLARFRRGAELLHLTVPFTNAELTGFVSELIERNQTSEAVLRLNLSRGSGPRGYSSKGCEKPTLVISLHPAPVEGNRKPLNLVTSTHRLAPGDAMAHAKTASKLPYILARAEAEACGADEALLLNTNGEAVEGAGGNLFWISSSSIFTPSLTSGTLAGVTRGFVLELCQRLNLTAAETIISAAQLHATEGLFLTNSVQGVVEVSSLDGRTIPASPVTARLRAAYEEAVRAGH